MVTLKEVEIRIKATSRDNVMGDFDGIYSPYPMPVDLEEVIYVRGKIPDGISEGHLRDELHMALDHVLRQIDHSRTRWADKDGHIVYVPHFRWEYDDTDDAHEYGHIVLPKEDK